ncbi:MAG: BlaI/MecI/CopY family transcriptional regulator [Acidobacteria bacterium]|nr:BlaI/MecI/CopY family transcriptional regulator [Acidobacteriota bacterium]
MPRKPRQPNTPPPLEMACLAALWKLGQGSVAEVREAIRPQVDCAYTTVQTSVTRLWRRGEVERLPGHWRIRYRPVNNPDNLRAAAVEELVRLYFGGSREELKAWLNGSAEPAAEIPPASFDPTLL